MGFAISPSSWQCYREKLGFPSPSQDPSQDSSVINLSIKSCKPEQESSNVFVLSGLDTDAFVTIWKSGLESVF